jgi:hypothetical protein
MAIFRQHIIKESTALHTLSIVLLSYIIIIINFGVTKITVFVKYHCILLYLDKRQEEQTSYNTKINDDDDVP